MASSSQDAEQNGSFTKIFTDIKDHLGSLTNLVTSDPSAIAMVGPVLASLNGKLSEYRPLLVEIDRKVTNTYNHGQEIAGLEATLASVDEEREDAVTRLEDKDEALGNANSEIKSLKEELEKVNTDRAAYAREVTGINNSLGADLRQLRSGLEKANETHESIVREMNSTIQSKDREILAVKKKYISDLHNTRQVTSHLLHQHQVSAIRKDNEIFQSEQNHRISLNHEIEKVSALVLEKQSHVQCVATLKRKHLLELHDTRQVMSDILSRHQLQATSKSEEFLHTAQQNQSAIEGKDRDISAITSEKTILGQRIATLKKDHLLEMHDTRQVMSGLLSCHRFTITAKDDSILEARQRQTHELQGKDAELSASRKSQLEDTRQHSTDLRVLQSRIHELSCAVESIMSTNKTLSTTVSETQRLVEALPGQHTSAIRKLEGAYKRDADTTKERNNIELSNIKSERDDAQTSLRDSAQKVEKLITTTEEQGQELINKSQIIERYQNKVTALKGDLQRHTESFSKWIFLYENSEMNLKGEISYHKTDALQCRQELFDLQGELQVTLEGQQLALMEDKIRLGYQARLNSRYETLRDGYQKDLSDNNRMWRHYSLRQIETALENEKRRSKSEIQDLVDAHQDELTSVANKRNETDIDNALRQQRDDLKTRFDTVIARALDDQRAKMGADFKKAACEEQAQLKGELAQSEHQLRLDTAEMQDLRAKVKQLETSLRSVPVGRNAISRIFQTIQIPSSPTAVVESQTQQGSSTSDDHIRLCDERETFHTHADIVEGSQHSDQASPADHAPLRSHSNDGSPCSASEDPGNSGAGNAEADRETPQLRRDRHTADSFDTAGSSGSGRVAARLSDDEELDEHPPVAHLQCKTGRPSKRNRGKASKRPAETIEAPLRESRRAKRVRTESEAPTRADQATAEGSMTPRPSTPQDMAEELLGMFNADWISQEQSTLLREQFIKKIFAKGAVDIQQAIQRVDSHVTGKFTEEPPDPRPCLLAQLTKAKAGDGGPGMTREDCVVCKGVKNLPCCYATYAPGVKSPYGARIEGKIPAGEGRKWQGMSANPFTIQCNGHPIRWILHQRKSKLDSR